MEQFTDTSFNKDFTQHYSLFLEIEEQQISFVICDYNAGKIAVLKRIGFNEVTNGTDFLTRLKTVISKEDFLHIPVKEIKIALTFPAFTLVPRMFFEEELAEKYLRYQANITVKETAEVNYIKKLFIKNVFAVDENLRRYISDTFTAPKIFHTTTALLARAADQKDDFSDSQLWIDVRQQLFHILYFENKEFKYLNQFQYKNKEDFMYFILLVSDQLKIDRNISDVKFSGHIVANSVLYNEVYKFFRNVSCADAYEHVSISADEEIPLHFYHALLSLQACE
ncbi:MAG: DUF3822 family protein [Chitinophagales bacterium]|nr:DUF3822 family protein [Chitinophagales bacterium]